MKTLAIILFATLAAVSTYAQRQQAVGNSKVNTDFSKFKTFTWAKTDVTTVGPQGYDIYYYEFEPTERTGSDQKMDKTKRVSKTNAKEQMPTQQLPAAYIYSYNVIIPASDAHADAIIKDAILNELEGRGYRENEADGDLVVAYQVLASKAQLHGYNNDDPAIAGGTQVRQPSDTATFALEPGSIIINLIDEQSGEVVWTGFESGMMKDNAFVTDEVSLKEGVHSIFNQFKYTADKARKD